MTDEQIRNAVCSYYGIPMADIVSPARRADIVQARSAYCALLRREKASYTGIGRLVGGRDHSTVKHLVALGEKLPLDNIAAFGDAPKLTIETKIEDWCFERFLEVDVIKKSRYSSMITLRNKLWRHLVDLGYTQKDIGKSFNITPAAVCEQLKRMSKTPHVPIKKKRPSGLLPGSRVWWAEHDAEVLEDFGPSVKVKAFGDVYTVCKTEVVER
jgi:hypothetical protein